MKIEESLQSLRRKNKRKESLGREEGRRRIEKERRRKSMKKEKQATMIRESI